MSLIDRFNRTMRLALPALLLASGAAAQSTWPTPLPPLPAEPAMPAQAPLAPLPPEMPEPPMALVASTWDAFPMEAPFAFAPSGQALFGPPMQRYPQDPADSLYREARQLLNRGEWRRAAALFARVADHRPASRYAADALHWQAFSLYRIGGTNELRQALAALESRKSRFPQAGSEAEASTLATRIRGALAARGDRAAEQAIAREAASGTGSCDSEELSVRSSALGALMRSDPEAAQSLLTRILDRKDECSVPLRKNAVVMLGTKGDAASKTKLASVVRSDPSTEVRAEAISYLAKTSGDEVVPTLEQVIRSDDDERLRRSAVRALGAHESPRAKAAIRALVENTAMPEALRLEALSTFDRGAGYSFMPVTAVAPVAPAAPVPAVAPTTPVGERAEAAAARAAERDRQQSEREAERLAQAMEREAERLARTTVVTLDGQSWRQAAERRISAEDATWLRNVYPRLETSRLKSRAVAVLARSGDDATLDWLMTLVQREEESADIRATVLSRLGRDLPISSLIRLFDGASNRTVRQQIVSTLGSRKEPEATDKLFDIVRTGTDPQLRRSAINALTRKNDPRTTQLLLELIDK